MSKPRLDFNSRDPRKRIVVFEPESTLETIARKARKYGRMLKIATVLSTVYLSSSNSHPVDGINYFPNDFGFISSTYYKNPYKQ